MTSSIPFAALRRHAPPGAEPASAGVGRPAEEAIRRLAARFAVALRVTCTFVAVIVATVTTEPGPERPWVRSALAVMVVSTVTFAAVLLRRPTGRWVMYVDVALATAFCVLQGRLLPPDLAAQGSTWIATVASMAIIGANLILPVPAALLGSLTVVGGWAAGSTLAGGTGTGVPHLSILLIQTAVAAAIMSLMVRSARVADVALDERERARRAEEVEAARRLDERVLRRRLHDTVLATLTMVGSGAIASGSQTLRARAAADLAVVDDLGAAPERYRWASVRLDRRLATVADRIRPLLDVAVDAVPCDVPAEVAEAMAGAVNEALVNVAKHAEVDTAQLRVRTAPTGVVVEVVDLGAGFDAVRVGRHHYGVRESIIGRMQESGGWARVRSMSGAGCVVTLGWERA